LSLNSAQRERFEAVWEEEMIRARSALEELSQENPLGAEVYSFNLNYLSLLEDIPMGSDRLGPWLGQLRRLGDVYSALDFDFFSRHFHQGPTSLSWLNVVVQAGWQVARGRLQKSLFNRFLVSAKEQVTAMEGRHQIYREGLPANASETGVADKAALSLAGLRDLLESYRAWSEGDETGDPPEELAERAQRLASEVCQSASDLLSLRPAPDSAHESLVERLSEAAQQALSGSPEPLRLLLVEGQTALERARRQGEIQVVGLAKADLQEVEHLQSDYRQSLVGFDQALELLRILAESPDGESHQKACERLDQASSEVEGIYKRLKSTIR
jgi:hypothetical protein